MSLNKAFDFYHLFLADPGFRKECYQCKTQSDLENLFATRNLSFTDDEFQEVITSSLFKCQTEEDALAVRQVEQAYRMLSMRRE